MARDWLARHAEKRRRKHRRFTATAAGSAVTAAIAAILTELWRAAWHVGWDGALQLVHESAAVPAVHDAASAESLALLEELIAASPGRARRAARTRLRYLETVLDQAVGTPAPPEALAAEIRAELASEGLAMRLALTETTWAISQATLAVYGTAGVVTVAWATESDAKVCAGCAANEEAGFLPAGVPFPSGAHSPPDHPNCRCALIPGAFRGWAPGGSPAAAGTLG